jgi:hypothetical protein
MLPEIGMMVGCYIITKLVWICGQENSKGIVKVFSAITIFVSIVVMVDLMFRGTSGIK